MRDYKVGDEILFKANGTLLKGTLCEPLHASDPAIKLVLVSAHSGGGYLIQRHLIVPKTESKP